MGLEDDFPVPEHLAPRLHVPASRIEEWKEVAQDEIMRALSHRHSWYNGFKDKIRDGFDMIADRPNLKAFIRPVPNTNDKDILIRSTLEGVHLDELVAGMYCETTYDVRCAFAHMYEGNFLDGAILQAHETRTDEDPMHFVGVRWVAFRTPVAGLITSRDFFFFSYEGTAYDVDGNRVLFRFLRTMPMDDIEIDKSGIPPLITGKISNLHFYRQNGSRIDAFTKAMHSNAGNMPAWVVTKTISFMFPGIANVETICDARALLANGTAKLNPGRQRFSGSSHTTGANLAVLASVNACGVCFHKFKMTRAKRRCQGCAREVCKRCTKRMFFYDEQKQLSGTGVVPLRFCLNCTRQARADVREANAQRASLGSGRRSSGSGSSHSRQNQIVRRVPSGNRMQSPYQPELEPPYSDSYSSSNQNDLDDSDDESDGYYGYNQQSQLATKQQRSMLAAPLQPHQLEQLERLQQQQQYDPRDHQEFLRLYNEYALRQQQQQARGKLQNGPPTTPQTKHRSQHPGSCWSHAGSAELGRGGSHASTMHMIPPMPHPDGPSARSDMIPLAATTRANSAPNLRAYGHIGPRTPPPTRAPVAPKPAPAPQPETASASEDLETIFRLRMLLFSGQDAETMSTASSSSSHRRALTDAESTRPQAVAQRH